MVIYRDAEGKPGFQQSEELDDAVRFVETIRNQQGVDQARIFRMEEVTFEFRPYFRVEIGNGAAGGPAGDSAETPAAEAEAGADVDAEPEPVWAAPADAEVLLDTPEPAEPEAEVAEAVSGGNGVGRRGLFGR
jgi:hypothetical protein